MTVALDRPNKSHILYRFYDRSGELLYVGITCNPPSRFIRHQDSKDWWQTVTNITIQNCSSRKELVKAEKMAIQSETPKFNIIHNGNKPAKPVEAEQESIYKHPLVGKFFHTTKKCSHNISVAVLQGHVTGFADGFLVIELFEWLLGETSSEELITTSDLAEKSVLFYPDGEAMRYSYSYGVVRHTKDCDDFS